MPAPKAWVVQAPTPTLTAEKDLVARIRTGDECAFESLYLAYHDALWRYAMGYVHAPAVAEELVQEVFLALWRDRANWVVSSSICAWLYGATRNHALNHLRHGRVVARFNASAEVDRPEQSTGASTPAGMGRPSPDAQLLVETGELERAVAEAISVLPERRRVAITLRWKHDLSAAEIAHVLGTTPDAVRVLLTRARQDLAGLLERLRD
jgi:RNA polymerase sigma-70 factor (ECF subfamily)